MITSKIVIAALGAAALGAMASALAAEQAARFATPDAAVAAVVAALEARDRDALLEVFGTDAEDVVFTDEPVRDREIWGAFLAAYAEMHRVARQEDGNAVLYIGRDQWPFPVPLVETDGGWQFDAAAARDEILHRRIGRNELEVIDLLAGYVGVQSDYRRVDYDGDGVMEFAASILSTPGARDGLYWPPEPGAPESPVGDLFARAAAEGYSLDDVDTDPEPFSGYYFRILTAQGENAPGGAFDYVVNGNMVGGHALLAVPAAYGESGIMSFMVAENGVVLEADLGEDTLAIAGDIAAYDPSAGWRPVE